MYRVLAVFLAVVWAGTAAAADQPVYEAAPAWVVPTPIPKTSSTDNSKAVQVLLQDSQIFFGPDGDQFYGESAVRILSAPGLSGAGNISLSWNPDTETLEIHKLHIIRGDNVIDVLAGGKKFTVLRRETSLELAMLDGTLTATIQPEDLRVGDILEFAFTQVRRDPVMQGRSEGFGFLGRAGVVGHARLRQLWPASKPIRWRATEGLGTPVVSKTATQTEVTYDLTDAEAPKPPLQAPDRFNHLAQLELTQFSDWAEVSALLAPVYRKAAVLSPDSPLRAEIERIRAASPDPKARAAAALHLVQDQTRYVFLGMNFGGYIPAAADLTWTRRFGDCKGKTTLLLAILRELGIDAQPALVNSSNGDGLDERLPMMGLFDHVLVRARIAGKTYWLDGTRLGDRGLDDLTIPDFKWALPIQDTGARLERLEPAQLAAPGYDVIMRLDASAGLDAPAPAHLDYVFRGDDAIRWNLSFASLGRSDGERFLREFAAKAYPWIKATHVDFGYDAQSGETRLSIDGAATMDWSKWGSHRDFEISQSSLGWDASFKREPGPNQDAPYAVSYPNYVKSTVIITLPNKGAGFSLTQGEDIDRTIAGVAYLRRSRIVDGVVTMEASTRSLEPEFPAAEAERAAIDLRDMSKRDVFVQSPSTYSASTEAVDPTSQSTPEDAAGFSARGAVFLQQRDFEHAVADFTKATQMEPGNASAWYNRGAAHYALGQGDLAVADFTQALAIRPGDTLALAARAEIYLAKGAERQAQADFDAVVRLAPGNASLLLRRAAAYDRAGRYAVATQAYDQLIKQFPAHPGLAGFLNARCWITAKWGQELDAGLAACDASLKLRPASPDALDSRGLVQLRLRQFDEAIADYDLAITLRPNTPESLYGRGIAKLRKGQKAPGDADIAAAIKLSPGVAGEFAGFGVKP